MDRIEAQPTLPPNWRAFSGEQCSHYHVSNLTSRVVAPQSSVTQNITSVASMRLTVTDDEIEIKSHMIEVDMWDRYYDFCGIMRHASLEDERLKNPRYLVIQIPLKTMMRHYHRLKVVDLKNLAGAHNITFGSKRKEELASELGDHQCELNCRSLSYVFKEALKTRPSKAWEGYTTVTRMQNTHSSTDGSGTTQRNDTSTNNSNDSADSLAGPLNGEKLIEDMAHLQPLSEKQNMAIIEEWQRSMSLRKFIRLPCAVCSELNFTANLTRVHSNQIPLHLLRNDDLPPNVRPVSYNLKAYDRAILDPQGLQDTERQGMMTICRACLGDLQKNRMPKYALSNWLYYGRERVPDSVRKAFEEMSIFEKTLISRARTNNILCKFTGVDDDPTGETFNPARRHIRGNIISTPMDVVRISSVLPPGPKEIADTMCALIVASRPPDMNSIKKLTPILVRKSRVKLLIDFLTTNTVHRTP